MSTNSSAVRFSLSAFPCDAALRNELGIPFGFSFQPFAARARATAAPVASAGDALDAAQSEAESDEQSASTSYAAHNALYAAPPAAAAGTAAAAAAAAAAHCSAPDAPAARVPMDDIARCGECLAYINCFATFHREQWKCPLCATQNK